MIIRICSFSKNGYRLSQTLASKLAKDIIEIKSPDEDIDNWVKDSFEMKSPVIFIGACGIAVRKIAQFVKDKLTDSPVIVIDEKGLFVIPVLSGHMGGANALSQKIAEYMNATAVITTATDVQNVLSIDVFAKENALNIINRDGIRKVSQKVLEEGLISISADENLSFDKENHKNVLWKDFPPEENVDVIISDSREYDKYATLNLCPKRYYVGVGCKKDTSCELIEEKILFAFSEIGVETEIWNEIASIATADIKEKEYGLVLLAQKRGIPFVTYSAEELNTAEGDFYSSDFVKKTIGVDNVCERAAVLASGQGSRLICKKKAGDGVTVAIALRRGL